MRLELTGRHIDITPPLRRLIDGKLAKLERLLNDSAVSAKAVMTRERGRQRVDITLHARGEKFLHGSGYAATWGLAVRGAIEKILQQSQKMKAKWDPRKRPAIRTLAAGDAAEPVVMKRAGRVVPTGADGKATRPRMPRVVRTDRRALKPMTLADAARELDIANDGGVVVFRDRETEAISVLYRRGGELTLVKTEA